MDICTLVDGFRYENGFYIVAFIAEQIFRTKEAFAQFQEIFKYVGKWKDTQFSIEGEGANSNFILFSLLQSKYNELYAFAPAMHAKSYTSLEKSDNPFEEGTDDWANWEIDNFKSNQKK